MIRNRVLWGVFAIIVCVSFVGAFSRTGGCVNNSPQGVATIFNQPVSQRDFNLARYFAMGMRDLPDIGADGERRLKDLAFRRIATLRMAAAMGVRVSDAELGAQITSEPGFQANGSFNQDRYLAFLQSRRIAPEVFEQYIREELVLGKISMLMQACVWAPAAEVASRARNLTDELAVQVAAIPTTIAPEPAVTADEAASFFEERKERFREPARASVRYVEFRTDASATGSVAVTEQDIEDYYVDHQGEFTLTGSNVATRVLPLEEVRDRILESFRFEKAFESARSMAASFSEKLLPDRQGNVASFTDMASAMGLSVHTTGLFTIDETIEGLHGCPSFAGEAFSLVPDDPEHSVSDPVTGSNAVYVISAMIRLESYIPELSNIVDRVMPLAASNAYHQAFLAAAQSLRSDVQEAIESGKTLAEALMAKGMNISTTLTFTAYQADPAEMDNFYAVVPAVIQLSQGELSDLVQTDDGALLLWVEKRTPGEAFAEQMLRPQVSDSIDRSRAGTIFTDWSAYVLNKLSGFKEETAPPPEDREEDDGSTPTPVVPAGLDENLG
jgi:hypothetical protein